MLHNPIADGVEQKLPRLRFFESFSVILGYFDLRRHSMSFDAITQDAQN